jgi:hypothetical protein
MSCACKHKDDEMMIHKRHQEICDDIHATYLQKNAAYGDSFHKLYEDLGIISAVTQITHKYNRLKTLAKDKNHDISAGDEPIIDTLLDMANYCIMTAMEIERENDACNHTEMDGSEDK